MMPGIGLNRRALGILSQTIDGAKKQFLDHDDGHQHREREWPGRVMRLKNLVHAARGDDQCGGQHA